ncbi:hTAFII28-like protein conserved region-domain-containing protein [Dissophora ornata]|nr:hTAFII28-like protein conserved region-domain-containing protein [Dissophora ornata]
MGDSSSPLRPVQSDTAAAFTPQAHSQSQTLPSTASTPAMSGPKKRKNAAAIPSLPKPKKQKLPRNLDSIPARNQLPNVPSTGGINKAGQRMVKGPYKKREKKDKDGKKIPAGASGASTPGASGSGAATGAGGRKGKATKATATNAPPGQVSGSDHPTARMDGATASSSTALQTLRDEDGEDNETRTSAQAGELGDATGGAEGGEAGAEGKDEDDDDHEEEPEYTEYEWNQEASSRGRSKEELKALLDCFSDEQLQRYEVYRRSVLSRPTVKKLVGTILNQQVTQTMAFVVAGFCKVFVGEMVEKAREVMEDWGETGAIRPEHLREAQRRYKKEELQRGQGVRTPYGYKRRMFCR